MAKSDIKIEINARSYGSVFLGGHDVSNQVKSIHLLAVAGKQPSVTLELSGQCDIACPGADVIINGEQQPIASAAEKANRLLDALLVDINHHLDAVSNQALNMSIFRDCLRSARAGNFLIDPSSPAKGVTL